MTRGRGWAAPLLLAVLAAVCTVVAVDALRPHRLAAFADPPGPTAPLLSPRRVPAVLSRIGSDARLQARLDGLLRDPGLGEARSESCLAVRDGGRSIYARELATSLIPASNLKLLTASAALEQLGEATRFTTSIRSGGPAVHGVIDGPLWLVGGGDPLLMTAEYAATLKNQPQLRTPVEDLARAVVAAGVREIRGGIVGDESRYDRVRYIPSWKPVYLTLAEVGPASALLVNDGFSEFAPRKIATAAPALHAAQMVASLLKAAGVTVNGTASEGRAPATAVEIANVASAPMSEIVGEMLRESDNTTAELLTKELGRSESGQGTTAAGVAAIAASLTEAGLPANQFASVDGSGLDRSDRATCGLLLESVARSGPDGALAAGLPIAGQTGTLSQRFIGNPAYGRLRAKTGALQGVAALSGWIAVPDGRHLAFAMVANGLPTEASGRALQERLGAVLAAYPQGPTRDELAPGGHPPQSFDI